MHFGSPGEQAVPRLSCRRGTSFFSSTCTMTRSLRSHCASTTALSNMFASCEPSRATPYTLSTKPGRATSRNPTARQGGAPYLEAVHRLQHDQVGYSLHELLGLVALQVPDEVPRRVRRHLGLLVHQLLCAPSQAVSTSQLCAGGSGVQRLRVREREREPTCT
jgi:hypothetical protein